MKTLKEIREGFFDNIGSVSPSIWLNKLKRTKSKLWKDQWAKEYRYKINGPKLTLIHDDDKYVFDFTKGLLWISLVKFCDLADEYVFTFEPYYGQIRFRLWSKARLDSPAVYINFNRNMIADEMKIFNRAILGIDEKLYRCKGCDMNEYISNRALIKYFIE